jgi:hypothetical protein
MQFDRLKRREFIGFPGLRLAGRSRCTRSSAQPSQSFDFCNPGRVESSASRRFRQPPWCWAASAGLPRRRACRMKLRSRRGLQCRELPALRKLVALHILRTYSSASPVGRGTWTEKPVEQQTVAILGWGSLIWDSTHADFDKWHDAWLDDGPPIQLEFSRVSSVAPRQNVLTLVVDPAHGSLCPRPVLL